MLLELLVYGLHGRVFEPQVGARDLGSVDSASSRSTIIPPHTAGNRRRFLARCPVDDVALAPRWPGSMVGTEASTKRCELALQPLSWKHALRRPS